MIKILVLYGVNLNRLGDRDKANYGSLKLEDINSLLKNEFNGTVEFTFIQSNSESKLIEEINRYKNYDGIIFNPGGYTHTSVALRDALENVNIPKIEVHLSNLSKRENFRKTLITTSQCDGYISGMKEAGFLAAVYSLKYIIERKKNN